MQVVYADVLVILNTYINFALLHLTSLISGISASRLRMLLSALLGGFYSLIILVDDIPTVLSFLLKAAVCALMTAIAFKVDGLRPYIKKTAAFLFVSFLFAGLMFALWIFIRPETMLYNNATVYFHFDTLTLLIATTVCYCVLRLMYFIIEKRAPKGHVYTLTVHINGRTVECRALLDSGNSLRDYFTSFPIIAVDRSLFGFIPKKIEDISAKLKPRYAPIATASGEGMMIILRPEKVRIQGIDCDFETKDVYIGLSEARIKNGDFEAILPFQIIQQGDGEYV